MKYTLAFLFSLCLLWSCTGNQDTTTTATLPETTTPTVAKAQMVHLNPQEFQAKVAELGDEQIIDVRTPSELAASGKIEGAVNIDISGGDFQEKLAALDKTKPVMVYCASGGRSKRAGKQFEKLGFQTIYELNKGFGSWENAKLPISK